MQNFKLFVPKFFFRKRFIKLGPAISISSTYLFLINSLEINSAKSLGNILSCLEKIIVIFVDSSPKFFFDGTYCERIFYFSITFPFFQIFFNISDKEVLK